MKKWYQSKTIWYAIITAVAGIVATLTKTYPGVAFISILNSAVVVVLRLISTDPITPTAIQ